MSADLFAEFGASFSQPQPQPQAPAQAQTQAQGQARTQYQSQPPSWAAQSFTQGHTKQSSVSSDPFAHLGSGLPSSPKPTQQTQQWPPLQQPTQTFGSDPWGSFASGGAGTVSAGQVQKAAVQDDDEDGWGDFETAEPAEPAAQPAPRFATPAAPSAAPPKYTASAPKPLQNPSLLKTRVVRASTIELMTNSLLDLPGVNALPEEIRSPSWARQSFAVDQQSHTSPPKAKAPSPKPQPKPQPKTQPKTQPKLQPKADADILFDADDFGGADGGNGNDDFGDFETVASPERRASKSTISEDLFTPPATARKTPAQLLSTLNLNAPASPYPQAPKSPSFHDRNPFPGLALNTPTEPKAPANDPSPSPVTAWPTIDPKSAGSNKLDDDWGAFEDLPGDAKPKKSAPVTNDGWDWDAFDDKPAPSKPAVTTSSAKTEKSFSWEALEPAGETKSDADQPPPINIPPPSVLLSAFPQLLGQANETLYKPISGQAFTVKNRILSDPKTIEFLRGYLQLATVAARIIAGRKQRWHRDKFLAQGMSISAAGSKGMKLAGIDKSQAAREDREAADVLDLWKEHVGRLRSSVAAANTSIKDPSSHIKIPELRQNMSIQTAKGVMQAPKACVICGLKRDERLPRIDVDVEDSFGEWWVEHWGHTACKRFWLAHEGTLRQR